VRLRYIDLGKLIAEAGGDPWAIDKSLQSGRPARISDLARAFHNAGQCTTEADSAFLDARRRFEASWNRENGEHPINDSAEVQRATTSLTVQAAQLPKIGVDLENVAATLAEAQRTSGVLISTLDTQLEDIDRQLGEAYALERNGHPSAHDKQQLDQHISDLERQAIGDTKSTLGQLQSIRSGYSGYLQKSLTNLRVKDGYDPAAIQGLDADGQPSREEQDQKAVDAYNANQRAKDQTLVDGPGTTTPEKADAAARLRDYVTATNPVADTDARRLASERLDDFNMAHFSGPLPVDPMLGGDARSRAQMRLEWQKKLQQGFAGGLPMTPDQVTQMLDNSEARARVVMTQQAVKGLERQGMSPAGAAAVVGRLSQGVPFSELAKEDSQLLSAAGAGVRSMADSASNGRHYMPGVLTAADADVLLKVGKRLGAAGTLIDGALAVNDWSNGAKPGERFGEFAGSTAAGAAATWATTVVAGSVLGPEGTFVAAIIASVAAAQGGGAVGKWSGGLLDH
jgi:hypothetical protein